MAAEVNLPFAINTSPDVHDHSKLTSCSTFNSLDDATKKEVEKNPFLLDYFHLIPPDTVEIPKFYPRLDKKLGELKAPNVLYPVGDSVYIHIYPDVNDVRNYYIPVEPSFISDVKKYVPLAEKLLVDLVSKFDPKTPEERRDILKECLRQLCVIGNGKPPEKDANDKAPAGHGAKNGKVSANMLSGLLAIVSGKKENNEKLYLTAGEYQALEYLMLRDKIGMGLLDPVIIDPNIEDITCDGYGPIFLEHKVFKGLKTTIEFNPEDLNKFVLQLSERIGKPITYASPIIDSTLPDGSRINIVYGEDVSKRGSNFTIRKFNAKPLSIQDIIGSNTIDYNMAAYLWIMIQEGMSLFVSGETASGKTTTLNAIMAFISPNAKIVSIEDTAEVQVPHKNWTREITRASNKGENSSDVGMFDLLKAALRQRPNYIIVGEIRGIEGAIAFQAIQTGHPVMSTFHAASVEKLIQRLTGDPINVPKTYVDNLNLVIIQSAVRRPDGRTVRRVMSINEIVGYNPQTKGFNYIEAFSWDPVTDKFEFRANKSSYLLEQKIARKLGIPQNKMHLMYDEIEKRKNILMKLKESGVTDYDEFFQTITKVEKQGMLKLEV
ncbi:MAG TPA: type II/IV secretion system ATPase subunit [Methanocella sp.]|uniref:type II/IV secretion system ATPase subunit n=1 Tax=Methanocella sp. TaxID=2052833 RepID=UPI002CBBBEC2|nr:type II/IV secretion system ATPase subunit [Methanocella sp.]HTY89696.1 type II/IV secretion system ATPase subunit [Methanocella sp.]